MGDPRARPTSGARRTAERATLERRSAWLRGLADTIAEGEPVLAAVRHRAGTASQAELLVLVDDATQRVAKGRDDLEHLAAELEGAAHSRARGDDVASGSLFRHGAASRHLADTSTPTNADVRALVIDVAADLPRDLGTRCRTRIALASSAELTILADLAEAGLTHDQLIRLLEGGHLLLPGHQMLEHWSGLDGVTPRTSSHYHPHLQPTGRGPRWFERERARVADARAHPVYGQQYGLRGKFLHEALFGPGPHDTTFIQLERAAPSKLRLVEHITDWIEYRFTRRNQGPYGSTIDTDADPIRAPRLPTQRAAAVTDLDHLETVTVEIGGDLAAEGRLEPVVWRGPSSSAFDDAVRAAAIDLGHAATAVSALRAAFDHPA
ncbi:MAG: hypothetical protein WEC34_11265 [Acidimicrobiia bacterium]